VTSPDAAPGSELAVLVFSVPNESAAAATTKVEVQVPADHPLPSVSVRPHPGWTIATTERALPKPVTVDGFRLTKAVATVTWTVAGSGPGLAPGEFDEFELSVGPLPETAHLSFPVVQTYSDGTVVNWNEPTKPGKAEPENPVPILELSAATEQAAAATASATGGSSSDALARWVALGALLLAAVALGVAILGRRRVT
jgi:uncharacterized protein